MDSQCGNIQVGAWMLAYDAGFAAGPGNDTTDLTGQHVEGRRVCVEEIGGRLVTIETYRHRGTASGADFESDPRGHVVARANTAVGPGRGLYLRAASTDPAHVVEFLAALRTLHVP
jgi:hypothetical protein